MISKSNQKYVYFLLKIFLTVLLISSLAFPVVVEGVMNNSKKRDIDYIIKKRINKAIQKHNKNKHAGETVYETVDETVDEEP